MTYSEFKSATRFKPIHEYTAEELDLAVKFGEAAGEAVGGTPKFFWDLLNGIDAYIERRRRKGLSQLQANLPKGVTVVDMERPSELHQALKDSLGE